LGATCGTIGCGFISNRFGRKNILLAAALIFIVASVLCYLSTSSIELICFRFFIGIAVGLAAFNAPLYLAEVAPRHIRGALISFYQTMVNVGILTALLTDTYFTYTGSWRSMLGALAIPAILMFIGVIFLYKSPRWLVLVNRKEDARKVLNSIRNDKNDVENELSEIEAIVREKNTGFNLFKTNKNFRKAIYLGIAIQVAQQITGINIMFYYAPKVFQSLGFSSDVAQMWGGVILGVTFLIFGIIAIFFIDKFGRKPLLYWGAVLMGVPFLILAFLLHIGMTTTLTQYSAVGCLVVFMAAFGISAGPIAWTLCSEICPLKGRGFGMACSTTSNWITNLIIGLTFLTIINSIGSEATFLLLGIINIALIILYYFFTPETKDVSLEHLEMNLMNGVKLRNIGK
ncbi:MAG TPA: sugar porter family MFS transporter, partial [Victivallales bacterium]|nr:sugar porter family MFS transporter [Victivallales bacterium]